MKANRSKLENDQWWKLWFIESSLNKFMNRDVATWYSKLPWNMIDNLTKTIVLNSHNLNLRPNIFSRYCDRMSVKYSDKILYTFNIIRKLKQIHGKGRRLLSDNIKLYGHKVAALLWVVVWIETNVHWLAFEFLNRHLISKEKKAGCNNLPASSRRNEPFDYNTVHRRISGKQESIKKSISWAL